jgi:hypothetical protein
MISNLLQNIGAVLGLCGLLWMIWDKRAAAPAWLLGIGLVLLVFGIAL